MTYRELVYIVLDEIKLISGDSIITEDHIIFLANKYRPFILKLYYDKELEKDVSSLNYSEICLKLTEVPAIDGEPCEGGHYLRSVDKIPKMLNLGTPLVSSLDSFQGINIAYISHNRFKFIGANKWMKNIIYCTKGYDDYLYFKSMNPQFLYLENVKFAAIFEDASSITDLSCERCKDDTICDPLDMPFPFEDHLFPLLLELILKEVLGAAYRPMDDKNDDNDTLSDIHAFIARNTKSDLAKKIDGSV